jgi:predicted  nucleic acid-binding Zn-ribbon protein
MAIYTTDQKIDKLIKLIDSQSNELKSLGKEIKTMSVELKSQGTELKSHGKEINNLRTEFDAQRNDIKELRKIMYDEFDKWDQKFFEFKSQIHDLIDIGFSAKAKAHDEEIEILNLRTSEIRVDIERLNNFVFAQ